MPPGSSQNEPRCQNGRKMMNYRIRETNPMKMAAFVLGPWWLGFDAVQGGDAKHQDIRTKDQTSGDACHRPSDRSCREGAPMQGAAPVSIWTRTPIGGIVPPTRPNHHPSGRWGPPGSSTRIGVRGRGNDARRDDRRAVGVRQGGRPARRGDANRLEPIRVDPALWDLWRGR